MSPVETKGESSPEQSGQLTDTESKDSKEIETKELSPKIEDDLEEYYRLTGSNQPKPAEAKPPASQDQK